MMVLFRKFIFILIASVFLYPSPSFTQTISSEKSNQNKKENSTTGPLEVTANIDKPLATIGEIITITLESHFDPDLTVTFPEFPQDFEGFDFVDKQLGKITQAVDKKQQKAWYRLRADQVGTFKVPPLNISYSMPAEEGQPSVEGEVSTPELSLKIQSVLNLQGEPKDIRDIKNIVGPGRDWTPYIIGAVSSIVALVLFLLWRTRKQSRTTQAKAPEPEVPIHIIAQNELNALLARGYLEQGLFPEFHFELSEIFRRYLGARYEFPAPDWTTEEIAPKLTELDDLGEADRIQILSILRQSDQVKFAKAQVDSQASRDLIDSVIKYVQKAGEREKPNPLYSTQSTT